MQKFSDVAWEIASRYSDVLASETRDLAGQIDARLKDALNIAWGNQTPVAWRYRLKGRKIWQYSDAYPEGPSAHLFEVEALYARPGDRP